MLFSVACEVGGTLCNVGANVYLARRLCSDSNAPVPVGVLAIQLLANTLWFTFACLSHDPYLASTSGVSWSMQFCCIAMRTHKPPLRRHVPEARSQSELQRFPISQNNM
jgi:hypothetical protein